MANAKHRQITPRIRSNPSQPTAYQSSTWRNLQALPCEPPDAGSKRATCPPLQRLSSVYATQGTSAIYTQTGTASDSSKASSGHLKASTSKPDTFEPLPSTRNWSGLKQGNSRPSGNSKPRPSDPHAPRVTLVAVAGHDSRSKLAAHSPDTDSRVFNRRSEAMPAISQARPVGTQGGSIHAAVPAQPESGSPVLGLGAAASVAYCDSESDIAAELTWRMQTAQRFGFGTWADVEHFLSAAGAALQGSRESAAQSEGSEPQGSPLPEVSGSRKGLRLVPSPDKSLPLTRAKPSGGSLSGLKQATGFSGKPSRSSALLADTTPRSGVDCEAGSSRKDSASSGGVLSNTPQRSPTGDKTAQAAIFSDPSELLDHLLGSPLFEGLLDYPDPFTPSPSEGFFFSEDVYYGKCEAQADTRPHKIEPLSTYGIPIKHLAHLAGVTLRTARRWKQAGKVSAAATPVVGLRYTGDLGYLHPDWNGFRLVKGKLWTPENEYVKPNHVQALTIYIQTVSAQFREIKALRQQQTQKQPQSVVRAPCVVRFGGRS